MRPAIPLLIFLSSFAQTAHSQDVCSGLLSYTGRDLHTQERENALAESLYTEHCAGSQSSSNSSGSLGIDAVVKAIPIKFRAGGSTSKEKIDNFCKIYDSNRAQFSNENIDTSVVVREALTAFNSCISMASRGIYFNPVIGAKQLSVDVRRGSDDTSITGLTYDPQLLECRLPPGKMPDGTARASLVADGDSVLDLGGSFVTITCVRKPQTLGSGEKIYPSAELTIATGRGALYVPIAADAELPPMTASAIEGKSEDLAARIKELENFTAKLKPMQLYQCPLDLEHKGGSWATWGCLGQISSQDQCFNYTHVGSGNQDNWYVRKPCTPIQVYKLQ